ncbi:calcium-binding protein [Burkholderia cepacia]|uniref:calcium-binding protein n=1 Tax=Burkholderia cepacia TaxID=292 RepID=UPI0009BD34F9|nr:calcium-binding protein [Burkholderia cepacia]
MAFSPIVNDTMVMIKDTVAWATHVGKSPTGPSDSFAQDAGQVGADAATVAGDVMTMVPLSAPALLLITSASEAISGDIQSMHESYENLKIDAQPDLWDLNPTEMAAQTEADLEQFENAAGQMIMMTGMAMTAAGFPEFGLPIAFIGAMVKYTGSKDLSDIATAMAAIKQWLDGNGPPPPPGGAGAVNDAEHQLMMASGEIDPVVLDLTGAGLNLTSLAGSTTYFDFSNDGFAQRTSWVGEGTGILCVVNPGETVQNGSELIESFSQLKKLAGGAQILDSSNPLFSQLRVWVSAETTGNVAGSGKLLTLSELGITSIDLGASATDQMISGNQVTAIANYTLADGSTREIASVTLNQSTADTVPDVVVEIPDSVAALPQVGGSGTVRDLRSAMASDTSLANLVKQFVALSGTTDVGAVGDAVRAIMYEWAGTANLNPTSRGSSVDARQLAFVEAYLGQRYQNEQYGSNPIYHAGPGVNAAWNDLYSSVFAQLVLQSPNLASQVPEFQLLDGNVVSVQGFDAIQAAYTRLGDLTAQNLGQWETLLRIADVFRLESGMPLDGFERVVAMQSNDTLASLANAIAANLNVAFGANGITESGTALNDVFYAGKGISLLVGKGGGATYDDPSGQYDTFIYNKGDGPVEIQEFDSLGLNPTNTLKLGAGIDVSSVRVSSSNGDIILTLSSGDTIRLDSMVGNVNNGVQYIVFDDGTQWTRSAVIELSKGASGATPILGTTGADRLDAGAGNHYAIGFGGNDTFVFDAGYGKLEIDESDSSAALQNSLQLLGGIAPEDVKVTSNKAGDVILTIGSGGDLVKVDGMLATTGAGVQQIQFGSGATWDVHEVIAREIDGASTGDDVLHGSSSAEMFDGKGGSDFVTGGGGGDTFVFNAGYGSLEIGETETGGSVNVLRLGTGISLSSLSVQADSLGDIILSDGVSGDRIQLDGMFSSNGMGVQRVEFADGTSLTRQQIIQAEAFGSTGSDTLYGTSGADVFDGKGGGDFVSGGGGADTFVYNSGYGRLEIDESNYGGVESALKLGAGIDETSTTVRSNGSDLEISDGIAGDVVTIDRGMLGKAYGVGVVQFADGTTWTYEQLIQRQGIGTTGADKLYGTNTAQLFDGNGGNDYVSGGGGADTFIYNSGYGNLEITEYDLTGSDHSVLRLGPGISESSIVVRSNGSDLEISDGVAGDKITLDDALYSRGSGVGSVEFSDGVVWSREQLIQAEGIGSVGSDTLYGASGAELFDGKGGGDYIVGGGGADTFVFNRGYGSLTISEFDIASNPSSILRLGAGIDESSVRVRSDGYELEITDGVDGDAIYLHSMGYESHSGVQSIQFADGVTWSREQILQASVTGGAGADTVYGLDGQPDYIDGKGGGDLEYGRGGNDTFVYNVGYGLLEISETASTSADVNVLEFGEGIDPSSISVRQAAWGVILTDGVAGDQITLDLMLNDQSKGVQEVRFSDGTTWTRQQLIRMATTGTSGADTIWGTSGADLIDGKGGNDEEIGAGGNDTFVFNQGYGQLLIDGALGKPSDVTVLQLGPGIAPTDVKVKAGNGELVLTDGVSGDGITLWGQLSGFGVSEVHFADGTVWSRQDLIQMVTSAGTTGNDSLYGSGGAERIDGKGGNDYVAGGGGNDTFVFNAGYGQLEISEVDWGTSPANVLELGGIDLASIKVSASQDGGDLVLTDGIAGDKITLDRMLGSLSSQSGVQEVSFSDGTTLTAQQLIQMSLAGTTGSDSMYGGSGAEVFDGKGGGDYEVGNGGSDTFIFASGYGKLEISESIKKGDLSTVKMKGIKESDLVVGSSSGHSLVLTDGVNGDQITVDAMLGQYGTSGQGVAQIQFDDGAIWTWDQLVKMAATGTSGNDSIYGGAEPVLYDGKGGRDYIASYGVSDTFNFNLGYGRLEIDEWNTYGLGQNVLQFGVGVDPSSIKVTASRSGALILTNTVNGDSVVVDSEVVNPTFGVDKVSFTDGTLWTRDDVLQKVYAIPATTGSDILFRASPSELIDGLGGDDYVHGGGGADTFVFNSGYGNLEISEAGSSATLKLGAGISASSMGVFHGNNGIVLTDGVTGDRITLDGQNQWSNTGVQSIQFSDGTIWNAQDIVSKVNGVVGTSGNDQILSLGSPRQVYDGDGGNDTVYGSGGGDTFIFNAGYGHLEISEYEPASAVNVLRLGVGINAESVNVSANANGGLTLTDGIAGDQINLDVAYTMSQFGVQQVQFADGTTWSAEELRQKIYSASATPGDDTITRGAGPDLIDGLGGNDYVTGGGGGDTFIFNAGYGHLQIHELESGAATNVLKLGAGIDASSVKVSGLQFGSALTLTDGVTGDQIILDWTLLSPIAGVQQVQFSDGTTWTRDQMLQMAATGSAGDDTLSGSSGNDMLDGKGGNDVAFGLAGDDTYVLQPGYGALTIVNGYAPNGPVGDLAISDVNPENIWLEQVGNDLHVDIMGTSTEATIQNWFGSSADPLRELSLSGGPGGSRVLDGQINQLIQAMAAFSANHPGFDPTSAANLSITDAPLLSVVNSSWHQ